MTAGQRLNKHEMYYDHISLKQVHWVLRRWGILKQKRWKRLNSVSKSLSTTENYKTVFNLFKQALVKKSPTITTTKCAVRAGRRNRKHDGIKQHCSIWTLAEPRWWVGRQQIAGHLCNLFWIQRLGDCSLQPICTTRVSEVVRRWMKCFRRILTLLCISITCPSIFDLACVQTEITFYLQVRL